MERARKIAAVVALLAIIVAVVLFAGRKLRIGGPEVPQQVLGQRIERIDLESLECITRTVGEWEKLGKKDGGVYKNPNTDKYTMVTPIVCVACRGIIPIPWPVGPAKARDGNGLTTGLAEMRRIQWEYRCPLCGELAIRE